MSFVKQKASPEAVHFPLTQSNFGNTISIWPKDSVAHGWSTIQSRQMLEMRAPKCILRQNHEPAAFVLSLFTKHCTAADQYGTQFLFCGQCPPPGYLWLKDLCAPPMSCMPSPMEATTPARQDRPLALLSTAHCDRLDLSAFTGGQNRKATLTPAIATPTMKAL